MKRVFIANRGEIAVRIIRACRELGLTSVVGYSDADRTSLAVRLAEEAYWLGPSPSSESYLNIPRIIEVIREAKCDAVHPGYGFLSERAAFAAECEREGVTFIGPRSEIIDLMGEKTRARQAAQKAGTPIVPGTLEPLKDLKEANKAANELGYPVMIKAAAGGGGKGMRLAKNADELKEGFRLAQSEAQSAFGDPSVYLEKKIEHPHHVEVQILADQHGTVLHLGERECSIQRRHQKVMEESPSPFISQQTRHKMWEVATNAARNIGYTNAGTIEFLVDEDQNFYFLEMNTRLQVEHPVTEMISGVDIVKQQIRIAAGEHLRWNQEQIDFRGHAIECRIYAEDADDHFMPSPGKILSLRVPGGPGIRNEMGVYEGFEVPIFYDPLMAKLIAWGTSREESIQRMTRALEEYQVLGVKTTIPFYQRVMSNRAFQKGNVTTSFIDEVFSAEDQARKHPLQEIALIAASVFEFETLNASSLAEIVKTNSSSPWKIAGRKEGLGE